MPKAKKTKKTRYPFEKHLLFVLIGILILLIIIFLNFKRALVFKGTVPCADCPGISETITFNADKTYTDENIYLERDTQYTEQGVWTIVQSSKSGVAIYELTSKSGTKRSYRLEQNKLTPLDSNLEPLPAPYDTPLIKQ